MKRRAAESRRVRLLAWEGLTLCCAAPLIAIGSVMMAMQIKGEDADTGSLVTCEIPFGQSEERLAAKWRELPSEKRKRIEGFLVKRFGLSSTGRIQLIGAYHAASESRREDEPEMMLHFRQVDLMGDRLFWSLLVDPEAETADVLYHLDERQVTRGHRAFGAFE